MKERALHELDPRLRQLALNARTALAQGDAGYAVDVLREVFGAAPGCAEMRPCWWEALSRQAPGWWARLRGVLRGRRSRPEPGEPLGVFRAACAQVEHAPRNATALRAMAGAARALGWSATECFAREAVVQIEPRSKSAALDWAEALQRHGAFETAQRVIDGLRQQYPQDGDVLTAWRDLGVARTLHEGRWEQDGSFRGKLRE